MSEYVSLNAMSFDQLVNEYVELLDELYDPIGMIQFTLSRVSYIDNRRPVDVYAERDIETMRKLVMRLTGLADGAFA